MTDYDFKQLNDKEFEILCSDILSIVEGRRFERFKPGKDAGVDGRFYITSDKEVILQCKHWANTPITALIKGFENTEQPKITKLNPHKYIIAVSNPLSRADKDKIFNIFKPYISSKSDIYGREVSVKRSPFPRILTGPAKL
ncbi:MAG: restriction endonuclease, partial [Prosthecobacter sp.]|nr:restriction endonuclease [Prosthecobacter sp.]